MFLSLFFFQNKSNKLASYQSWLLAQYYVVHTLLLHAPWNVFDFSNEWTNTEQNSDHIDGDGDDDDDDGGDRGRRTMNKIEAVR